jgi:hypothetical protein
VAVQEFDVTKESVRARMTAEFGRVATPAIVIGKRVFWGFEDNREEIGELLGLEASAH